MSKTGFELTAEEVLIVFFDMEDNGTGQLHFSQQVEVSQDEKDFTLRLVLCDHELLVSKQIIVLILVTIRGTRAIRAISLATDVIIAVQVRSLAVLAISERENIVPTLDDEHGEVQVSELEVDVPDFALS